MNDFGQRIKEEITNAECVLAIISSRSLKSLWVNQEIGFTLGKDKPFLPIKKQSISDRGCGFLHSNIDSQVIRKNQSNFPRINLFFEEKFEKESEKQIHKQKRNPKAIQPMGENKKVRLSRV